MPDLLWAVSPAARGASITDLNHNWWNWGTKAWDRAYNAAAHVATMPQTDPNMSMIRALPLPQITRTCMLLLWYKDGSGKWQSAGCQQLDPPAPAPACPGQALAFYRGRVCM